MSGYEERLVAPPSWWVGGLAVALLLAAALHSGADDRAVVPYVVLPLVVLGVLGLASRGSIQVADGTLHVPGARIPLTHVGGITPLDREGTRRLRGPYADPRAYVATRPWLTTAVRVQVEDPQDDTPYWVVGTRRPQELAAALDAQRR